MRFGKNTFSFIFSFDFTVSHTCNLWGYAFGKELQPKKNHMRIRREQKVGKNPNDSIKI